MSEEAPAPRSRLRRAAGAARRTAGAIKRILLRAAWVVVVLAISLGGAGLVSTLDHQPGTAARDELTWAADRAVEPSLDAAAEDLRALGEQLDELGELGREALVALVARKVQRLDAAVAAGAVLTTTIGDAADDLRASVAALPGTGPGEDLRLDRALLDRRTSIDEALAATDTLDQAWSRLATSAVAATRLTGLLEAHDAAVLAATADGRGQRYRPALQHLARADAALADALELRDRLRNTTDVSTLNEWLGRSGDYDRALRRLYTALRVSTGRVTREVREAFAQEQAARQRLPAGTNGLVIIMNDIARAGVNDAVIVIEIARGEVQDVLEGLDDPASASEPG
jgi:hypothetical protein